MPATKTQLIGGLFQDADGTVLNSGYLTFELSQDEQVTGLVTQVCAGVKIKINLNTAGSVSASPAQNIWGNDDLLPINSFYIVSGYTASGQLAWGPNYQQVTSGATFDVGTWTPNLMTNWTPPLTSLTLEHNGVVNGSQSLLNLKNGSNVTITDDGLGGITIASATAATLKTNGTLNTDQSFLNLQNGSNITITNPSTGNVQIAATIPAIPATLPSPLGGKSFILWRPNKIQSGTTNWETLGDNVAFAGHGAHGGSPAVGCFSPSSTRNAFNRSWSDNASNPHGLSASYSGYGSALFWAGRNITFQAQFSIEQDNGGVITDNDVWCGMFDPTAGAIGFVNSNDPTTYNFIAFKYVSGTSADWICGVGNGSATTYAVSSPAVAVAAAAVHTFKFVLNATIPSVTFYIDGTAVATISTHVPTAAVLAGIFSTIAKTTSTDAGLDVNYLYAENDVL
jgi:hypothetical protein